MGLEEDLKNSCRWGYPTQVKELLLDETLELNEVDEYGLTPLMWSSSSGHTKIVELLLLDTRTDVNMRDRFNGRTAFYFACRNGRTEVVKLMLENESVDINKSDNYGWTPLMITSYWGNFDIVQLVLANGRDMDLSFKDNEGKTAIERAREGSVERKGSESIDEFTQRQTECPRIVKLLEKFQENFEKARLELRHELGIEIFQEILVEEHIESVVEGFIEQKEEEKGETKFQIETSHVQEVILQKQPEEKVNESKGFFESKGVLVVVFVICLCITIAKNRKSFH